MTKIKAAPFILMGTILHISASVAVAAQFFDCDTRSECVSSVTRMCADVLAFPLILVRWIWQTKDQRMSGGSYLYVLINSLLAVTLVWFVVKQFLNRGERPAN